VKKCNVKIEDAIVFTRIFITYQLLFKIIFDRIIKREDLIGHIGSRRCFLKGYIQDSFEVGSAASATKVGSDFVIERSQFAPKIKT
jgi:hypothetical protein